MNNWIKARKIKRIFRKSKILQDYFLQDLPEAPKTIRNKLLEGFETLKAKYSPEMKKRKAMIIISIFYLSTPTTTLAFNIR